MANHCTFLITAQGDPDSLDRFAGYIHDAVQNQPGDERHEVCFRLDDGMFGDFNRERDVPFLWLPKGHEVLRTEGGDLQLVGSCKWEAPITWLERASNLIPGITFSVRATIEYELFQTWEVANGKSELTHQEVIPLK